MIRELGGAAASIFACLSVLLVAPSADAYGGDGPKKPRPEGESRLVGKELYKFAAQVAVAVAFSPDGEVVAFGDKTGLAVVCEAPSGKVKLRVQSDKMAIWGVAFLPDGKSLAAFLTGINARTVKNWDIATGRETYSAPTGSGTHRANANHLIFEFNGTVTVCDPRTGKPTLQFPSDPTKLRPGGATTLSADGNLVANAGRPDNTIRLWQVDSKKEIAILKGHEMPVAGLCFSPSGKRIASAARDGSVRIWDTTSGAMIRKIDGVTNRVAYSPDGKWLAFGSRAAISIRDAESGKELLSMKSTAGIVQALAFNGKGTMLAAAGTDCVQVLEILSQKAVADK